MTPYSKIFKILYRKFSPPHRSTLMSSNFVKCCQWKISEIVRYLPHKKLRLPLNSRYCVDHVQNLPKPTPNNVLRVLQISSKSVHFRQSYSRTHEHHQIAHSGISNIRLKPSFQPSKNQNKSCEVRAAKEGEMCRYQ